MDWKDLKEKALALAKKAKEKSTEKTSNVDWKGLQAKAKTLAKKANAQADHWAEQVAAKTSKVTGREVTKKQVKHVVITVGVIMAAGAVMDSMAAGAGGEAAAGGNAGGGSGGSYDGFDNSFEGQSHEFFADKGGLNIETVMVDAEGCQI